MYRYFRNSGFSMCRTLAPQRRSKRNLPAKRGAVVYIYSALKTGEALSVLKEPRQVVSKTTRRGLYDLL